MLNIILPFFIASQYTGPYVYSYASSEQSGTGTTTHLVTMPSGVVSGDLLLVLLGIGSTNITTPTGWTAMTTSPDTTRYYAFYKVSNGTEGSSVNFVSSSTGRASSALAICVKKNNSTPIDSYAWGSLVSSKSVTSGSITGGVLTATTVSGTNVAVGDVISGVGIPAGVIVTGYITGSGGSGSTMSINNSSFTVSNILITTIAPNISAPSRTPTGSNRLLLSCYLGVPSNINNVVAISTTLVSEETKVYDKTNGYLVSVGYLSLSSSSATGAKVGVINGAPYSTTGLSILVK